MFSSRTFLPAALILGLLGTGGATAARAADHRDSPDAMSMADLDINDVYAFRSPADNNNLVVILSVHPYRGATPDPLFATDGKYEIYVSNSPDGAPDETPEATVKVTFSGSPQQFRVSGLGADITGAVGQTVSAAGIKVFCGPRDDPFFFDLDGFKHFVSGPYIPTAGYRDAAMGTPVNFFNGANVGAIVLELPITSLTGKASSATGVIKAWAKSFRQS